MTAQEIVANVLKAPYKYTKPSLQKDCAVVAVHQSWLSALLRDERLPDVFVVHDALSDEAVESWIRQREDLGPQWTLLSAQIVEKSKKTVLSLPRGMSLQTQPGLSFVQLLHYVSQSNHKNLWKEAYKQYSGQTHGEAKDGGGVQLLEYDAVVREILCRIYNCPFVGTEADVGSKAKLETHPNVLPAFCVVESPSYFIVLLKHKEFTVSDCVTFSPAILNNSVAKPLFVIYEFLQYMKETHDRGLAVGDISLHDLAIDRHLWLQAVPQVSANIFVVNQKPDVPGIHNSDVQFVLKDVLRSASDLLGENEVDAADECVRAALGRIVEMWVRGSVSNFDYLMTLCYLAGRRYGIPNHHPVLPWIMDFSSPYGGWRDLSKSKFRLNKGDQQLDLTYEVVQNKTPLVHNLPVPHHISDVLSEITYYVYKARQTPKDVLCKYVRTLWVPAEYPQSIQRMQQWTPDECIPEFYNDPSVFKSIHDDLPDLEIPQWANTPEDFINSHRAALEGSYVSERLHHWIDLTFGYKLSGTAAVKAKNVCLHLVDMHTHLANSGVIQLFTHPHPHRATPSPYLGKMPPKLPTSFIRERRRSERDRTEEAVEAVAADEEDPPSVAFSRFLSRSRTSLAERDRSDAKHSMIYLPKDYNPVAALNEVEALFSFSSHTTQTLPQNSGSALSDITNYKQMVASRRIRDMQVLGCLMCEICIPGCIHHLGPQPSLDDRYKFWVHFVVAEPHRLPPAVKQAILLLLQPESHSLFSPFKYPAVTDIGLPPPSAHQFLEPLITVIPFPTYFPQLYALLRNLTQVSLLETEALFQDKDVSNEVGEYKVKTVAHELVTLLPQLNAEGLHLILPYVKELMRRPATSVLATWHLFDPIAQALGPYETACELLDPLLLLFDSEYSSSKHMKLYHRSFILQLIIRFGLRMFLHHFVAFLIEGAGGCRDFDTVDKTSGRICQRNETLRKKSSYLSSPEAEINTEALLSPFDEDSSQANIPAQDSSCNCTAEHPSKVPEESVTETEGEQAVFVFEQVDDGESTSLYEIEGTCGEVPLDLMDQLEQKFHLDSSDSNSVDAVSVHDNSNLLSPGVPENTEGTDPSENEDEVCHDVQKCSSSCPIIAQDKSDAKNKPSDCNISDLCAESIVWLAHRLGPVLTARHLTRNLLRMLTLCYSGEENQVFVDGQKIIGDEYARRVLECLSAVVALYGERFVLGQYFPHMAELIASTKKKFLLNLEGGVIGCMALLTHIIPYLADATVMDQLQDGLVRSILAPSVRLFSSSGLVFPCHGRARLVLAWKTLEAVGIISKRIGVEMSQKYLLLVLHKFFCAFDKVFSSEMVSVGSFGSPARDSEEILEIQKKAQLELCEVFTPQMAHAAYIQFYEVITTCPAQKALGNIELIHDLYLQYESQIKAEHEAKGVQSSSSASVGSFADVGSERRACGSLGSNVAVVGNRIDVQLDAPLAPCSRYADNVTANSALYHSHIMENSSRHLKGNWLAYWEHEIGRSDKDTGFNFKQIKLQTFSGHINSIRKICALDNENSFVSCSKDKTVKLWSLRSQGDGTASTICKWTYAHHKKSVLAVDYMDSLRLVASCDSTVHVWDPFVGALVRQLDGTRGSPVNVLKAMPSPSTTLLATTTDATVRFVDLRACNYVRELKASLGPSGLIRCIATSPNGHWIALGHSTGILSVLDVRTGMLLSSWKGHEGEVLQLVASGSDSFVSSSLDQLVSSWSAEDGKFRFHMGGLTEPVHCLCAHGNGLVSGTTANRIGVHASVEAAAPFSSTRLRVDTFKGVLTCMTVLPLNQLLLVGSDNGSISVLC